MRWLASTTKLSDNGMYTDPEIADSRSSTSDCEKNSSILRRIANFSPLLALVFIGTAVVMPIMFWGIPAGADLNNHYRFALPFYEAIQAGNLYPSWLAESNAGYGDTRFRFYPPGLYYLLSAAKIFTNWYSATIIAFTVLSILGALGVFCWARHFFSPNIAMLAGVLYTVAPYRLNELYQASLLSEYAACSVLPFAFAFVEQLCRNRKATAVAGLAVCYAVVILTHLPLTVIGSLSLVIYAGFRIRDKHLLTLASFGLAILLGLAASAFYWHTLLAELPWINGNEVEANLYYDYRVNFLFSPGALTNRNTWYANILSLAAIGFMLPGAVILKNIYSTRKQNFAPNATIILTLVSFLMTTELSRPLWAIIPKLQDIQFPWRWLAITSMCGSIILAASLPKWVEIARNSFRPRHLVFGLSFTFAVFFISTQILWDADYMKRSQFDPLLSEIRGSVSFKNWLPVWAREVVQLRKMSGNIESPSRQITITSWQPEHRSFQVFNGPAEEARVRTYFYPYWSAAKDGVELLTRPAEDGALLISLPPEAGKIDLKFREPRRTRFIFFLSVMAWLAISLLLVYGMRQDLKVQRPGELRSTC